MRLPWLAYRGDIAAQKNQQQGINIAAAWHHGDSNNHRNGGVMAASAAA